MTPLRRLGNKAKLLPQLLALFPERITCFIDLFMGSGAVSFAMAERCKYVIANDNDDEVFNLFLTWKERKAELIEAVSAMPYHQSLWQHWKTHDETDPVWRAARFLMFSNFGYLGTDAGLHISLTRHKRQCEQALELRCPDSFKFMNMDFRQVLNTLVFRDCRSEKATAFIYADPPYLDAGHNYATGFAEQDSLDLFAVLTGSGIRFAMSEFRHPFIVEQAAQYGLHVTSLGERQTLKNRQEEILITNYDPQRKQAALFEKEHYATLPN